MSQLAPAPVAPRRPPLPFRAPAPPLVQLAAALLGAGPLYVLSIVSGLESLRSGKFVVPGSFEMLVNVAVVAVLGALIIALLYVCGERARDLNLKPGTLGGDIVTGIGLFLVLLGGIMAVNLAVRVAIQAFGLTGIETVPESNVAIGKALVADPWLLAVFLGPVVWLQAGLFEELTRVFVLTRLWHAWPRARAVSLVAWSLIFGLAHLYQGAVGVLGTAVIGLILGAHYMARGRYLPLVIAHALYDTVVIFMLLYVAQHPELLEQLP